MPQGEFWYPERGFSRPVAMTANLYGRPLAAAEAFTHMQPHWSVYPAILKPCADVAFCDGINHLIWHTFTASPKEFGKPGIEYFAGSHLNPNVTWFEQSGAFLTYLARCQFMLRQGKPVVDVCCYTGDRPYLHWGRGEKWSANPTLTLDRGYTYDLINTPVLLERVSVANGRIVLPEGMSYSTLVLDLEDDTAPPSVLRKIIELVRSGGTVVLGQRRPTKASGLNGYPQCDEEVRRLADQLWGPAGEAVGARTVGEGRVVGGVSLRDALAAPPTSRTPLGNGCTATAAATRLISILWPAAVRPIAPFVSAERNRSLGSSDGPYPGRRRVSVDERRTHGRQTQLARFRQRLCRFSPSGRRRTSGLNCRPGPRSRGALAGGLRCTPGRIRGYGRTCR